MDHTKFRVYLEDSGKSLKEVTHLVLLAEEMDCSGGKQGKGRQVVAMEAILLRG